VTTSIDVSLWQVAAALALVALAAAISFWRAADLERDIVVATVRSFVQLTLVGYAIKLIFEADTIWLVLALLTVMVFFGALTARHRGREGAGLLRAAADRPSRWPAPAPSASSSRWGSSNRPRATWSRSAAW
jgi:ABC-type iron transport system FetAB permease component